MNRRQALLSIAALPAVAAGVAVAGTGRPAVRGHRKVGIMLDACQGWKNYTCEYTSISRGDLIREMRMAVEKYNRAYPLNPLRITWV
jgi:hypothetical protein